MIVTYLLCFVGVQNMPVVCMFICMLVSVYVCMYFSYGLCWKCMISPCILNCVSLCVVMSQAAERMM